MQQGAERERRGEDDLRVGRRTGETIPGRKPVPPKSTLAEPSMALSIISRAEFEMRGQFIWRPRRPRPPAGLTNGRQARYCQARLKWGGETGSSAIPFSYGYAKEKERLSEPVAQHDSPKWLSTTNYLRQMLPDHHAIAL